MLKSGKEKASNKFKDLFDKFKNSDRQDLNHRLQPGIREFKEYIFNTLTKYEYNMISDFNNNFFNTIRTFQKTKPCYILECDKNVGSCITQKSAFLKLAQDHLNCPAYSKLPDNPLQKLNNYINYTITNLFKNKHLHQSLYKFLVPPTNSKLGKFRIYPNYTKKLYRLDP
jgi:hypothetical protein